MAGRAHYRLFSPGRIGRLALKNRLVRSATWDPAVAFGGRMTEEALARYRRVARGGVGLIITGDFSAVPAGGLEGGALEPVRIEGYGRLARAVHEAAPDCKIVAQISADTPGVAPSAVPSPFPGEVSRPLSAEEVGRMVSCLAAAIADLQEGGFDGVQLHAAHGGLLSRFLSPYFNRRTDAYGGSAEKRARIVREVVDAARRRVGDFPILIKLNGTDYLPGGLDLKSFGPLARAVEAAGVDAVEVSGGTWEALARGKEALPFRPVPSAESQTGLVGRPGRQSYFLPYAESLDLSIPVILVGGNRHVERLEAILGRGRVDFIALCRPLIHEPELPQRWLEGRGGPEAACIACNSCLWDMYTAVERGEPGLVSCLYREDQARVKEAQRWLAGWVEEALGDRALPPP